MLLIETGCALAIASIWRNGRPFFIMADMMHALAITQCTAFIACLLMTTGACTLTDFFHVYPVPLLPEPVLRGSKGDVHVDVFARAWGAVGALRDTGRSPGANDNDR